MNNDLKTTILGAITAVFQLLSIFHIGLPTEVSGAVGAIALAVLAFFTNKK